MEASRRITGHPPQKAAPGFTRKGVYVAVSPRLRSTVPVA